MRPAVIIRIQIWLLSKKVWPPLIYARFSHSNLNWIKLQQNKFISWFCNRTEEFSRYIFEVRLSDIQQANFHTYQLGGDMQIFLSLLFSSKFIFSMLNYCCRFCCGIESDHLICWNIYYTFYIVIVNLL